MTMILMRKGLAGRLEPVDDAGRDFLAKIAAGSVVSAEVKRPRNIGHHRKFFALVNMIWQNQTRYKSPDELLDAIKVHIGHATAMTLRDGTEVRVPKSISFASMDQAAFDAFWDRVVQVVCAEIIPGLNRDDLERELLDLVA